MFSSNCNDSRNRPVSDIMGPGGIPKPKSLLSSFLFSRLSSQYPQEQEQEQDQHRHHQQQQQQQQQQDCYPPHEPLHHPPLSLQSHLLPPSLLGDVWNPRSRTVTDDSTPPHESSRKTSASALPLLPPPRRSWSIASDGHTALPKVPVHYPPFDPNCTALVTDAPPSIVGVRISECLRRRSIAVEYDDEAVTARCMTVDRVHFKIQLYRTPSASRNLNLNGTTEDTIMAPPHDSVIVEVQKITGGSSMSFYAACSKILLAAKGLDTGDDERPSHHRNGMEFKPRSIAKRCHPSSMVSCSRMTKRRRLPLLDERARKRTTESSGSDRSSIAEESLEAALALLQKDRLECQQLGMERLVNLTNKDSVGNEICRYVSRRLLLQESNHGSEKGIESSSSRWKLIDCLMHPGAEQALGSNITTKHTPNRNETKNDRMVRSFLESPALTAATPRSRNHISSTATQSQSPSRSSSLFKKRALRKGSTPDVNKKHLSDDTMSPAELRHEARLRSLALRMFCNALDNLSKTNELPDILHPPTNTFRTSHKAYSRQTSRWMKPTFLLSLVQDLRGAGRPPSVSETGYKLASVHEAALAARCLRLLAGYDSESENDSDSDSDEERKPNSEADCGKEQHAVRDFLRSDAVLERLEYARSCGRATHAMLQYEAELTYNKLTEHYRSC